MSLSNGNAFSCGNVWWTMAEALSLFFCSHFHFLSHSLVPTFTFTQLVFVLESILSTWAPPDKRLFAALVNLNRQTNDETWQFCNYEIWTEYMTLILVEKQNYGCKWQISKVSPSLPIRIDSARSLVPGHDRDSVPHPLLLRRHPRPPDRDGPQEGLEGGARHVPLRPQRHLRLPRHLLLCYIDVIL